MKGWHAIQTSTTFWKVVEEFLMQDEMREMIENFRQKLRELDANPHALVEDDDYFYLRTPTVEYRYALRYSTKSSFTQRLREDLIHATYNMGLKNKSIAAAFEYILIKVHHDHDAVSLILTFKVAGKICVQIHTTPSLFWISPNVLDVQSIHEVIEHILTLGNGPYLSKGQPPLKI